MMILKVCQQVCQNLWSGIIQHMSDCDILLLCINMVRPMKSLQSELLRQTKDRTSITQFPSSLLSKTQPVQHKTRHRNKSWLWARQQVGEECFLCRADENQPLCNGVITQGWHYTMWPCCIQNFSQTLFSPRVSLSSLPVPHLPCCTHSAPSARELFVWIGLMATFQLDARARSSSKEK